MNYVGGEEVALPSEVSENESLASIVKSSVDILQRRWLTLLLVAATIFVAIVGFVLTLTPTYQATARVRIDPSRSAAMGQLSDQQTGMPDQTIVDTEVGVMNSADIARAVTKKLDLSHDSEITEKISVDRTNPTFDNALVALVKKNMTAAREKATYIIGISYESTDPAKAARIANAFADEYIEYAVGSRSGTAERQSKFLDDRLRALARQKSDADQTLAQYRAATGVVDTDNGNRSVTDQQIAPLSTQLATAESDAAAARSKVQIAKAQIRSGGIDAVSAVLNSEVIRNLRAQRAQMSDSESDIASRYGPRHPETIKVQQQLQALDQQINDEAKRIIGGLESEASAANARAASLRSDLITLRGRQSVDLRATARAETLKSEAEAAQNNYNRLASQAQSVGQMAGSSMSQAQIVDVATPPIRPSKPKRTLLLAAGLLFALISGLAVVSAQELLSTGLRTVSDMRRLGLELLATVQRLNRKEVPGFRQVIQKPMSSFAESFRVLRSSLNVGPVHSVKLIVITSTLPEEGKTTTALSLARIMGLAGERTLLIDADLRHAAVGVYTGRKGGIGLVEVLHGEATPEQAIVPDEVANVSLLTVASSHFSPEDMFSGDAMSTLLSRLRERYDRIIIDSPPLLGVADARTLAVLADAVILAVKWNTTPRNAIKSCIDLLRRDNANLIGAVYTMADTGTEAYGALYYSRKYSKYYVAS